MTVYPFIWIVVTALLFIYSALSFHSSSRISCGVRYGDIPVRAVGFHSTTSSTLSLTSLYSSTNDDNVPNPIEEFEKDLTRLKGEIDDKLKTGQEVVRGIQETPEKLVNKANEMATETGKIVKGVTEVPMKTKKVVDNTVKTTKDIVDGIVSAVDTIATAPTNFANTVDTTVKKTTNIVESIKEVPVQTKRVINVIQKTPSAMSTQASESKKKVEATVQSIQKVPIKIKGVYKDVNDDIQSLFLTISKYRDKLVEWWNLVQKSPEKIKQKAIKVQSNAKSTVKTIQEVPKNARSTFMSVRKGVIEAYNMPGQAYNSTINTINGIQSTTQSLQKRSKLVKDQGLSGLFVPIDRTSDTIDGGLLPEVTLSKEQLKGGVFTIFDLGEKAILKAFELAEKPPDYLKQTEEVKNECFSRKVIDYIDEIQKEVDSSIADIKSIPQKVDDVKTKAQNQLKATKEKVKTFQRQVQDVGQVVWSWVSLKEPKRISKEVTTTLKETKENLDTLQKSLAEDVGMAKLFVEESAEAVKKLPSEVQTTTENLKSTYDSIFKDVNYITKSVGKAVNTLEERLVSKGSMSRNDKSADDITSLLSSKPATETTKKVPKNPTM